MADRDIDRNSRERDLVLAPNEAAFISDETKGNINVYVGPHKTSLANTDRPVVFNDRTKRFDRCSLEEATQTFSVAPEGWYLVLKNPARDGSHPRTGALNNLPELEVGRKVNIPGPVSFAMWPGQMMRVLQGHHLRSNQYLVVRVYDEGAARANWKNAVIKPQSASVEEGSEEHVIRLEDLTMGKLLVIMGTAVAFYIPPTGIEVVPDASGQRVREAVTLERLEYCILLDEDGNKRFIRGPAVVLPRPTETFVEKHGSRKFRAIELNENSGIYVKVIAPYEDNGVAYKVGDELFITGRDQMIYFPRPEHAIIRYGEQEIHYAIAIPAGWGRYVLDRNTGKISIKPGPCIFLPDPRKEVIVRRVLEPRTVALWFPGNTEAQEYNRQLQALRGGQSPGEYVADATVRGGATPEQAASGAMASPAAAVPAGFAGDQLARRQTFTQPRSIVLDTRFEGAVSIDLWTGYSMLVVSRTGERKVHAGPTTHLLEYDETLQAFELSTGTPKTEDRVMRSVYLRVLNNKVSDIIEAETRDLCRVRLQLSYRVNFEGDPNRWFNVENYVKFLTEHLRSVIRHAVKQQGIEGFYADAVANLRDVILGAPGEDGKRAGRAFAENGMRVYDVEVLDVTITDDAIGLMLVEAQRDTVRQTLALAAEQRRLVQARQTEDTRQQIAEILSATRVQEMTLRTREVEQGMALQLAEVSSAAEVRKQKQVAELAEQEALTTVHVAGLARQRSTGALEAELEHAKLEARLQEMDAEVRAITEKARAVSPDIIAALQAFSDRALTERVAESMAPLAILGGESVTDVLGRLLKGTSLARLIEAPPANED